MIGASKLLVRLTVRMRACCLSSLDEEMAICVFGAGEPERARLMRAPPGGEALRLDMAKTGERGGEESEHDEGRDEREYARP